MDSRIVVAMLREEVLNAFDREVWEWGGLECYRDPHSLRDVYRGRLRVIGAQPGDEYHDFQCAYTDAEIQGGFNWYHMLRDRAIFTLRTSMEHRAFVRRELEGTVTEEINPDEVQEIWY